MSISLPKDLEAEWEYIVKKAYKGDQNAALRVALTRFLEEEQKKLPKGKLFDSALDKVTQRQEHSEEIFSEGLSEALERMRKRKERGLPI